MLPPPPIALYGADADNFLEDCGISLYDDFIVIGEEAIDGIDGENLLEEYGIFLCEDCVILEGQQAEEYKARKAKEAEDKKKTEDERNMRRYRMSRPDSLLYYAPGSKDLENWRGEKYKGEGDKNLYHYRSKDDSNRHEKANKIVKGEEEKRSKDYDNSYNKYKNYSKYIGRYDDKSRPIRPTAPGDRPKGLFKGKEKKEYYNKVNKYNDELNKYSDEVREHSKKMDQMYNRLDKMGKDVDKKRDAYIRSGSKEAMDATNRHIRRHPKQYKESTIFESVDLI